MASLDQCFVYCPRQGIHNLDLAGIIDLTMPVKKLPGHKSASVASEG